MTSSIQRFESLHSRSLTGMSVMALWLFVASLLLGSTTAIVSSDQGYTAQLDQSLVASHTGCSRIRAAAVSGDTDQPDDIEPPNGLILAATAFIVCPQLSSLPAAPASLELSGTTAFNWPQLRAPPLA